MRSTSDMVFAVLGDPTRRAIFERLRRDGPQNVRALTGPSGVSQPAVSKHLAALRQAGLVHGQREGREMVYRIETKGLEPLLDWTSRYGPATVPSPALLQAAQEAEQSALKPPAPVAEPDIRSSAGKVWRALTRRR